MNENWLYIIGILSGLIVIKSAWAEVLIPLFKYIGIEINTKQNKELKLVNVKLDKITERMDVSDASRDEGRELQVLILEGVTASLNGLHELKCNGPVTNAIKKIEDYKLQKAVM